MKFHTLEYPSPSPYPSGSSVVDFQSWLGVSGSYYGIDRAIDRGDEIVHTTYRVCDYCGVPIIIPQSKYIKVVTELSCPCCGAPIKA